MRWLAILAITLLVSSISAAQDTLEVSASTPLHENLRNRFGWGELRVGCGKDDTTLLALVPRDGVNAHEVVSLTRSGVVKAWIDVERLAELERAEIEDFAPAPNGDIYILARRVSWLLSEQGPNQKAKSSLYKGEPLVWLLRFNSEGQAISKAVMKVNFAFVRIAVFPSGSLLALGYLSPGQIPGRHKPAPFSAIVSPEDGSLVLPVDLPEAVLEPKKDGHIELPIPMLAEDGDVYVVVPGEAPMLTVVRPNGTLGPSVRLRIPKGYLLSEPRAAGLRLIAEMWAEKSESRFAELDVQTGELLFLHSVQKQGLKPTCQVGSSGIVALDPDGAFDVLSLKVEP